MAQKKERIIVQVTPRQLEFLDENSKQLEISRAEYLRRVIDQYIVLCNDRAAGRAIVQNIPGNTSEM